jgi:hypothetical protein
LLSVKAIGAWYNWSQKNTKKHKKTQKAQKILGREKAAEIAGRAGNFTGGN